MATPSTKFYLLRGGRDEIAGKWYIGRVRIFFINKFTHQIELNILYNPDLDIRRIKETFESLHFKVDEAIMNPTASEMIRYLREEIDYFGCAVIFVFSHGEENFIYCSDYNQSDGTGKINVWKDYYYNFSGHEKPQMQKKPKVFFNEWCQVHSNTRDEQARNFDCGFHNTSHWLIYNAALSGFKTHYHEELGSYSTQAFCQRLNDYAQTKDLVEILCMVTKDVCKIEVHQHIFLHPIYSSTLDKKLFLLPEDQVYKLMNFKSEYQEKFKQIGVLGEGRFAVVFKALHIADKVEYAVKRIQLDRKIEKRKIKNEIKYLATLSHENIVRYHNVWFESIKLHDLLSQDSQNDIWSTLRTDPIIELCYIQFELCGDTLEQWLKNNTERDKVQAKKIFQQILQGLDYIHKKNVVHRDIKPDNIWFAITKNPEDLCVRIAEFGLCICTGNFTTPVCVAETSVYTAPELLRNKCTTKSDMYSIGLMLIELLYNCSGEMHDIILNEAKEHNFPQPFQDVFHFAVQTLKNLLSNKSGNRPTCEDLINTLCKDREWSGDYDKVSTENNWTDGFRSLFSPISPTCPQNECTIFSICTREEHLVNELSRWSASYTLLWNVKPGCSDVFCLPVVENPNVQWEVQLCLWLNDDFGIKVRCKSLDHQFRTTLVRLFAVLEEHPHVWIEAAKVLKSEQKGWWWWCCWFSKKMRELTNDRSIRVKLCLRWTELDYQISLPLSPLPNFLDRGVASIHCRWFLQGWKSVSLTSQWWYLFSEPFGRSDILWRLVVMNYRSGMDRKLYVQLQLQHLPSSFENSGLELNCTLSLWKRKHDFEEKKAGMVQGSSCMWNVFHSVNLQSHDPLDLKVIINIGRPNMYHTSSRNDSSQINK